MTSRYYIRKQPDSYYIHDHKLGGMVIAFCAYKEQATLVCKALNAWEAQYQAKTEVLHLPPESIR